MDFYKLIKSLDELVYEVLSWLYFYPRTLWQMLTKPVATMRSVERELRESEEEKFDQLIGPPLFLALTLGLIHLGELLVFDDGGARFGGEGLGRFLTDDKNLLAMRVIIFGMLPLIAGARLLRRRGHSIDKNSLRPPFYAQCYAAAVYAMLFNAAILLAKAFEPDAQAMGLALFGGLAVALLWIGWVEARWFHHKLASTRWRAFLDAAVLLGQWLLLLLVVGMLLG